MKKGYALFTSFALLGLGASAQSMKPGVHARTPAPVHQRGSAPANDECAGAIALTVGTSCSTTNGSSADATESMAAASDCGPYTSPEAPDTWYSFVAGAPLTIVEMTGIADYDAIVQGFSGSCGSLVPLACSDVNYPVDPFTEYMTETLSLVTTPGETYYLRTYYYTSPIPASMDFTICVYNGEMPTEYCIPSVTSDCDEFISGVTIGSIASTSECTASGYNDYTAQATDLAAGTPVPITVLNNPDAYYSSDSVSVWGDWNHDFLFAPNERIYLGSEDDGLTYTGAVNAPLGALNGETRLRVRMVYDSSPSPCGESSYGETEDYTVNVTGGSSIGITEHVAPLSFFVYPNPSNGDFTLTYGDAAGTVSIDLLDMTGRTIATEQRYLTKGQNVTLSLAGKLAAGAYSLRLSSATGRSEQRVLVK